MIIFLIVIFWIFAFVISWSMIGYGLSLKLLSKVFRNRKLIKDYSKKPTVSVMIVAHNEEKVIKEKLENVTQNDYPKDKIEYIVASDFCTDSTNEIVNNFIEEHPNIKMILYCSKEHKGKTNAQNEAQKVATGEILVMTDANAMFEGNAISELVATFTADDIAYVTGRLSYVNADSNVTASSESSYWEGDLQLRQIESNIKTITAGNGAIYAVRNALYHDFPPISCHDGMMPAFYAEKHMRSLYNSDAVAYEKAGEVDSDEFKRKVRMSRTILKAPLFGLKCANVFKYGWFSYFHFGHRTCRKMLWISHAIVLIASLFLGIYNAFYLAIFAGQIVFYTIAAIGLKTKATNKLVRLISYYTMTVLAQWKGVINGITGKNKPTWESAETTR